MSTNTKVTIGLVVAAVLAIGAIVWFNRDDSSDTVSMKTLVRSDSHKLQTATDDDKVTVTEFLDFQCPACGSAYPGVEQLRKEFDGQITYVVRNFPLDMHPNAMPAAQAAEAAAMQGKYVEMYNLLFQNQQEWSGQDDPQEIFNAYATQLGLDLTKFQADMQSDAVAKRIAADKKDGEKVEITGTPTFFINNKRFTGTPSFENLKKAVNKAKDK